MDKNFYKSWTFWGVVLLSAEAGLKTAQISYPAIEPFVIGLGSFLTMFGFRRAMK